MSDDIVPCRYVHGEMVPLSAEELAERKRQAEVPTGDDLIRSLRAQRGRTAGYRLSVEEKRRIKVQTGHDFEDHGQYKAWCKANGKRDVERGEIQDVMRRDLDEWERDGKSGPAPWGDDVKGFGKVERKRDISKYLEMLGGES